MLGAQADGTTGSLQKQPARTPVAHLHTKNPRRTNRRPNRNQIRTMLCLCTEGSQCQWGTGALRSGSKRESVAATSEKSDERRRASKIKPGGGAR
jgi:hypothetical protein